MWYNINWNSLISNYVWKTARKPRLLAYLLSLVKPIRSIHSNIFNNFYSDTIDRAKWNSQVMILEQILNEKYGFDYVPQGIPQSENIIYITSYIDQMGKLYFFNEIEYGGSRPVYFGNEREGEPFHYMFNEVEYKIEFDFIINVPQDLNINLISSITNDIKLIDKKYMIIYY